MLLTDISYSSKIYSLMSIDGSETLMSTQPGLITDFKMFDGAGKIYHYYDATHFRTINYKRMLYYIVVEQWGIYSKRNIQLHLDNPLPPEFTCIDRVQLAINVYLENKDYFKYNGDIFILE